MQGRKHTFNLEEDYHNMIKHIPVLNHDEVLELFKKYKNGDLKAREKIIVSNLKLVRSIALNHLNTTDNKILMDLIQEGTIGLMRAIEYYNPDKNIKFNTYAYRAIGQSIRKYLTEKATVVRYPSDFVSFIRQVNTARRKLEQENFRKPTNEELAKYLKITEKQLDEFLKRLHNVTYLDATIKTNDDELDFKEILPYPNSEIENNTDLFFGEEREIIRESLNRLKSNERYVIEERFGLLTGKTRTLNSIAKDLNLTKERIRQIQNDGLKKLKRNIELKRLYEDASFNNNDYVGYRMEYKETKVR